MEKNSKYTKIKNLIGDRLIQKGLRKGQNNYQKFIILSDYRSGSNFLMNLLKSHPETVCYSELFYSKRLYWASLVYGRSETDKKALDLRKENPIRFLDRYCYRKYNKKIKAVGFKLMYHDIYKKKNIDLQELLERYPDMKVIHLIRKNQLERLISVEKLYKTGVAVAVDEKYLSNDKVKSKVVLNKDNCEGEFIARKKMLTMSESIIEKSGCDSIVIYYENLSKNKQEVSNSVSTFLGITNLPLSTNQIKQNKRKAPEIVENYQELKAYFANTEWKEYFED